MSVPVDLELKKAFADLQLKMQSTAKKINVIDSQLAVLKRLKRHLEVQYISLPTDKINTYEAMGRMFLLTDIADIKTTIQMKMNQVASHISELVQSKLSLDKNLKQSQDNIREMVYQHKEKARRANYNFE